MMRGRLVLPSYYVDEMTMMMMRMKWASEKSNKTCKNPISLFSLTLLSLLGALALPQLRDVRLGDDLPLG